MTNLNKAIITNQIIIYKSKKIHPFKTSRKKIQKTIMKKKILLLKLSTHKSECILQNNLTLLSTTAKINQYNIPNK